jgi:DNA-binding transcriptional LysR family regulator
MNSKPLPPRTRMKIRQILLLAHIDREQSLLRAADAAGISQPAASKLLKELEDGLGVSLFDRHARGVAPTDFGEIVVRHAHSILSEIHQAQEEVAALKRGERYRVAIGSVLTPSTNLLPKAIELVEKRHPQMLISIEIDTSRPLINKLLMGQLDIVIGRVLDPENAADLRVEMLAEESHSLIGRANHPLARKRKLRIEDLGGYTWVVPLAESILRERLQAMFLQRGLSLPLKMIETSSLPVITRLLQNSDLLAALPEEVVRPYCDAGMLRVIPIELNVRLDAFGIITRRNHVLSKDANEALTALREIAKKLYTKPLAAKNI